MPGRVTSCTVFASHVEAPLAGGGWVGVDVFFVLSGYLITTILLAEHECTGRIQLGAFYLRRLKRLYPALILLLVGFLFADDLTLTGGRGAYARVAALAVTCTMNLAVMITGNAEHGALLHTWSLAVEEQFYLLWPIALIVIVRRAAAGAGRAIRS